jgi:hypothetical protein
MFAFLFGKPQEEEEQEEEEQEEEEEEIMAVLPPPIFFEIHDIPRPPSKGRATCDDNWLPRPPSLVCDYPLQLRSLK